MNKASRSVVLRGPKPYVYPVQPTMAPAGAGSTVITDELAFPPQSTEERAVVHRIAHILGLQHQSRGKGAKGQNGRYVTVRKRTEVEA